MWTILTVLLLVGSFFYLFVCVDANSGSFLAKTKIFLFNTVPVFLRQQGRRTCGNRFVDTVDGIIRYVCFTSNPFVQILYLFLAVGGFFIYVRVGFSKFIPGPYVGEIHKVTGTIIMALCYLSFLLASWTDPGVITK